jgi:hypothetical protein
MSNSWINTGRLPDHITIPAVPITPAVGEAAHNVKLTDDEIREIRAKYATGGYSMRRLGAEYGVSGAMVHHIVRRKNWTHL